MIVMNIYLNFESPTFTPISRNKLLWFSQCYLSMQETQVWSLNRKDPLEKEMATHSSILDWEIPWTEEPDCLESMESQKSLSK